MIVNCVAYQEGRKLADIQPSEIRTYVSRPECFVWVALREPSSAELDAMQEEFGLHPLAVEDARHGHQRPKIEEYGDSLFAVLHTVEVAGQELNVGEVAVFVGRNYVLSIRSHTERGFAEVRSRCEREPELLRHGSGYVLYAIMDAVVVEQLYWRLATVNKTTDIAIAQIKLNTLVNNRGSRPAHMTGASMSTNRKFV